MTSSMSLPGFDGQLRDHLDDKIRAGSVSAAEADTYLWLLQATPAGTRPSTSSSRWSAPQ